MNSLLRSMLHQSFEFDAMSYEIYENGCCIQNATCHTHISAKRVRLVEMVFEIRNNPTYINDKFSFTTASDDLLKDRVQYGRLRPIDSVSGIFSKPIVCNIFPQNGVLRFATPNPLRIVEFSGNFRLI